VRRVPLSQVTFRLRNVPAGPIIALGLDPAIGARFTLGDPVIGFRILMPDPGQTFLCQMMTLEPLRLSLQFGRALPSLTVVGYVEHTGPQVGGRTLLPVGSDLQILTAFDLQSLIGDTSWRVRVAGPSSDGAPLSPGRSPAAPTEAAPDVASRPPGASKRQS
jgi:hypothetical protein